MVAPPCDVSPEWGLFMRRCQLSAGATRGSVPMMSNPSQVIVSTEDHLCSSIHALAVHHRNFPEIRAEGGSAVDAASRLTQLLSTTLDSAPSRAGAGRSSSRPSRTSGPSPRKDAERTWPVRPRGAQAAALHFARLGARGPEMKRRVRWSRALARAGPGRSSDSPTCSGWRPKPRAFWLWARCRLLLPVPALNPENAAGPSG